jgi:hypothetical protein
MNDELVISDLTESVVDGWNEVSAKVDGDRVFFRSPAQYDLAASGEPFLGVALLEAMARNADLRIDPAISLSAKLHGKLQELQSIYACWSSDLHRINVHARVDPRKRDYERVASFFSAGVDGSHTLLRNMDDITHLILLFGFEVEGNDRASWFRAVEKQSAFARTVGKELIPIEANVRWWADKRKIMWIFAHGLVLSSLGSLLKAQRLYVPSSHTYNELFPWGSHPLTDPMWSTESTEVIHDGAGFRRGEKIKDLCGNQKILDNIKVCWRSIHENCGECPKCIRTMTSLYLLGASSRALPNLDLASLKRLRTTDESGATYLEDAMILARNAENRRVLKTLRRYYRRYQLSLVAPMLDHLLLGGVLRRIYRTYVKLKKPKWSEFRITLRGLPERS